LLTHRHICDCCGARHGVQGVQAGSDFRLGARAKTYAGLSLRVGGENAAPHHHVFVRGQADALLLLMEDQGKLASKRVARFLAPPSRDSGTTSISISGEGVAGHRAIDSALHLEIEEQATVAGQNRNAAPLALLLESPGRRNLFQCGQSSCFSMTLEALSVMIRRMTFGVMMTPSVSG
jgi:hypothetical protein